MLGRSSPPPARARASRANAMSRPAVEIPHAGPPSRPISPAHPHTCEIGSSNKALAIFLAAPPPRGPSVDPPCFQKQVASLGRRPIGDGRLLLARLFATPKCRGGDDSRRSRGKERGEHPPFAKWARRFAFIFRFVKSLADQGSGRREPQRPSRSDMMTLTPCSPLASEVNHQLKRAGLAAGGFLPLRRAREVLELFLVGGRQPRPVGLFSSWASNCLLICRGLTRSVAPISISTFSAVLDLCRGRRVANQCSQYVSRVTTSQPGRPRVI